VTWLYVVCVGVGMTTWVAPRNVRDGPSRPHTTPATEEQHDCQMRSQKARITKSNLLTPTTCRGVRYTVIQNTIPRYWSRDATHSMDCAISRCTSVCITLRYCVKTAKSIVYVVLHA